MGQLDPATATIDEIAEALWNLVLTEGSRAQRKWEDIDEDVKAFVRQDAQNVRNIWDRWAAEAQQAQSNPRRNGKATMMTLRCGDPIVGAVMEMASSALNTGTL